MALSEAALLSLVSACLSANEKTHAVVYGVRWPLQPGVNLNLPKLQINVPGESYLMFVDRDPGANWSHSSRYLLIDANTGAVKSFEAQLPPFGPALKGLKWEVMYKAPEVPSNLLAVPFSNQRSHRPDENK